MSDFTDLNDETPPEVSALVERVLEIREKARRRNDYRGWQERLEDRQAS